MNRRSFIAAATPLAVLSGCLDGNESGSSPDGDGSTAGEGGTGTDRAEPPFDVTTVDGPGSDAGTVSVPTDGQVQLVNFTRLNCPTSKALLPRVAEARDRLEETVDVGPDGTVHVLSVIDGSVGAQPSATELADWWADQDGDWTIGNDETGALDDHYDVTLRPTTIAIDGTGEVHWGDEGGTTVNTMVNGVETALEAAGENQ
ncbi:TlpA family protein disulfide reductase [Natronorubrum sp. DTA28]|uniref:TlpA family protein disulfide reductase n=1 Tax=Natronorubrum sp. DTA28 TaxID=3447019 RepID=UPI003F840415